MPLNRKACDACRVRRTKCTGHQPCHRCAVSDLPCTFNIRRRKRGPTGRVVSQLRSVLDLEGQSSSSSSLIPQFDKFFSSDGDYSLPSTSTTAHRDVSDSSDLMSPTSSAFNIYRPFGQQSHRRTAFLQLHDDLLRSCLDDYIKLIYPLYPVIASRTVKAKFEHRVHLQDQAFAALILSLAALPLMLPSTKPESFDHGNTFIDEAMGLHHTLDLGTKPTLESIATSMLIGAGARIRKGVNASYLRIREAITLAELLNLDHLDVYETFEPQEKEVALCILWLLTANERSLALLYNRRITLKGSFCHLSSAIRRQSPSSLRLQPCTRLFEIMDDSVINCINCTCYRTKCDFNAAMALTIDSSLEAVRPEQLFSQVQMADLLVTRQWLQIKVWQASVMHSIIDHQSPDPPLRLEYPLTRLLNVSNIIESIPFSALLGNGQCMGAKLLCIAHAASSMLSLPITPKLPDGILTMRHAWELESLVRQTGDELSSVRWLRWETD